MLISKGLLISFLKKDFLNVIVRGLSILVKFLSLGLISRQLPEIQLNLYFVIVSIAGIYSAITGLQGFNINLRNYNKYQNKKTFSNQFSVYVYSFIITIIIVILLYNKIHDYVNREIYLLFLLCLSEFIVFELSRFLIIISRNLISNIVILFNASSYLVWILICKYIIGGQYFSTWKIILIINSILLGTCWYYYLRKKNISINLRYVFNYRTLNYIYDARHYIFSQLLSLTLVYFSRFALEYYGNRSDLTVYSILYAFANIVNVFITVGIIAPDSPRYLKDDTIISLKDIRNKVIIIGIIICTLIFFSFPILVKFIDQANYISYWTEFGLLLLGSLTLGVAQIYQVAFLKFHKDKYSLYTYFFAALILVLLSILLIDKFGVNGAVIAYFSSGGTLFILRFAIYKRTEKNYERN